MKTLFSEAGRAGLIAFIGLLITLAPGILNAPNLNGAITIATAAIIASVIAALKAVQVYVPQLSLGAYFGPYGSIADAFLRALVAGSLVLAIGVLSAPDYQTGKAIGIAGVGGVVVAAVRAAVALLSPDEKPALGKGIPARPIVATHK